jgi:hypothetical protein
MDQLTHYPVLSRADYVRRDAPLRDREIYAPEQEDSKLPVSIRILSILAMSAILWTVIIATLMLAWHFLQHLA